MEEQDGLWPDAVLTNVSAWNTVSVSYAGQAELTTIRTVDASEDMGSTFGLSNGMELTSHYQDEEKLLQWSVGHAVYAFQDETDNSRHLARGQPGCGESGVGLLSRRREATW